MTQEEIKAIKQIILDQRLQDVCHDEVFTCHELNLKIIDITKHISEFNINFYVGLIKKREI